MTYTTQEAAIREPMNFAQDSARPGAQLDTAHIGDIRGGLGSALFRVFISGFAGTMGGPDRRRDR